MDLSQILHPQSILVPLREGPKEEIIRQLVDALPLDGGSDAREQILQAVFERERVMSTGIGRGVALPHGKSDAVPGLLASVGITANPVPYEAIDGKPCRIFVLLVANPRTTQPHIQALATLSKILNDPARKSALETATFPADVMAALGIPAAG